MRPSHRRGALCDGGNKIHKIDKHQLILHSHQAAAAAAAGPTRVSPTPQNKNKLGIIRVKIPTTRTHTPTPTPTPLVLATYQFSPPADARSKGKSVKKTNNNGPCVCPECHRRFESRRGLGGHKRHCRSKHCPNNNNSAIVIAPPPRDAKLIGSRKCESCEMLFPTLVSLLCHIRDYHHITPPQDNNFQPPPPLPLPPPPPPNPNNPSKAIVVFVPREDIQSLSWGKKGKRKRKCFHTSSSSSSSLTAAALGLSNQDLQDVTETFYQISYGPVIFQEDEDDLERKRKFIRLSKKGRIREWERKNNKKEEEKKKNLEQLIPYYEEEEEEEEEYAGTTLDPKVVESLERIMKTIKKQN